MKINVIVWRDHWSSDDYGAQIELEPWICTSVGYVMREDKMGILLVRDLGPNESEEKGRRFLYILKADIISRKVVK